MHTAKRSTPSKAGWNPMMPARSEPRTATGCCRGHGSAAETAPDTPLTTLAMLCRVSHPRNCTTWVAAAPAPRCNALNGVLHLTYRYNVGVPLTGVSVEDVCSCKGLELSTATAWMETMAIPMFFLEPESCGEQVLPCERSHRREECVAGVAM